MASSGGLEILMSLTWLLSMVTKGKISQTCFLLECCYQFLEFFVDCYRITMLLCESIFYSCAQYNILFVKVWNFFSLSKITFHTNCFPWMWKYTHIALSQLQMQQLLPLLVTCMNGKLQSLTSCNNLICLT